MALSTFEDVDVAASQDFTYEMLSDGTLSLTGYHGVGGTVVVPDHIDGNTVTALGDGLFQNNLELTALSIPESVTVIGEQLLTGCRSLRVLRVPQLGATRDSEGFLSYFFGATSPNGTGFRVPSSLDTVILTDTVKRIPENAFLECSRLRIVVLPESLQSIGAFAFFGCSQLHYLSLPQGLSELCSFALANCTSLYNLTLPSSLTHVGSSVLLGCTSLEQLTLPFLGADRTAEKAHLGYLFGAEYYTWNRGYVPASLKAVTLTEGDVADYAFYDCPSLSRVTLAEDATRIGIRAFWGCTSLQEIALPNGLTEIDELAFAGCTTLPAIRLPDTVQTIGLQAFMGCSNLTEIDLPDSLRSLPSSAFANCYCLQTVHLGGVTDIGAQAFRNCFSMNTVMGDTDALTVGKGNELFEQCLP